MARGRAAGCAAAAPWQPAAIAAGDAAVGAVGNLAQAVGAGIIAHDRPGGARIGGGLRSTTSGGAIAAANASAATIDLRYCPQGTSRRRRAQRGGRWRG